MRALHERYAREQPQSRFWVARAFELAGAVFAGREGRPLDVRAGLGAPEFAIERRGGPTFFERDYDNSNRLQPWAAVLSAREPATPRAASEGVQILEGARRAFHHEAPVLFEAMRQAELDGALESLADSFFDRETRVVIQELDALAERARLGQASRPAPKSGSVSL